jgi:GTP-binding protein Era
MHKAGFVNIVGKPNAGKSTLMNALVGEKMSIITPKAQTTRHRIMGIVNQPDLQIIFSDTPGAIEVKNELQKNMMVQVQTSLQDADIIILLIDLNDLRDKVNLVEQVKQTQLPTIVVLNKMDLSDQETLEKAVAYWEENVNPKAVIPISALHQVNVEQIMKHIEAFLPEHPAYFDKDQLTDKPERFFVSEIIREKLLLLYREEIPYACEVVVESFKREGRLIRIEASVITERNSQKGIIIGRAGLGIKNLGTKSRLDIEDWLESKVHLELTVKVIADWRKKETYLKQFGYSTR